MIFHSKHIKKYIFILFLSFSMAADSKANEGNAIYHPWSSSLSYSTSNPFRAINSFDRPNNPMLDRAFGYLLKSFGKTSFTCFLYV